MKPTESNNGMGFQQNSKKDAPNISLEYYYDIMYHIYDIVFWPGFFLSHVLWV